MNPKEDEQHKRFREIREYLTEKIDTLPSTLRFRFITHLLCLSMEGKRDEAFKLLMDFVEGRYQPSLEDFPS